MPSKSLAKLVCAVESTGSSRSLLRLHQITTTPVILGTDGTMAIHCIILSHADADVPYASWRAAR
jgi:hypothetical protein